MADTPEQSDIVSGRPAILLALAGYLPFLLLLLAIGPLNDSLADFASIFALPSWFFAHVMAVYGAVILSFLGGIRWGVAMVGRGDIALRIKELVMSTAPALAGWAAVFMPRSEGLFFLAICFVLHGFWDLRLVSAGRAPQWFRTLRRLLTILVSVTLFLAGSLA